MTSINNKIEWKNKSNKNEQKNIFSSESKWRQSSEN